MNEREKFRQINKEARATAVAVAIIIVFWLLAGFGLAGIDITVCFMPLWAFCGCVGTALLAVAEVWFLTKKVFKDMDLDSGEEPLNE